MILKLNIFAVFEADLQRGWYGFKQMSEDFPAIFENFDPMLYYFKLIALFLICRQTHKVFPTLTKWLYLQASYFPEIHKSFCL